MKKKISVFMLAMMMIIGLTACSSTSNESEESSEPASSTAPADETVETGNVLTIYYSWSGNTESVAQKIHEQVGGDIIEIIPTTPYSDDYDTVIDVAQEEQRDNARPEINAIENIDQYDTIIVGYPNWWGDMPMLMYTFFDTYDLSNKTIAPFATSSSSGLSQTVSQIQEEEPNATVTEGLSIRESQLDDCDDDITSWLSEIGIR